MNLIDSLIKEGWLKSPRIIEAFNKIERKDFLREEEAGLSEMNEALPIGYDQTISQPLVVAFMLEKLDPRPGEKILDIGSGSGWTSVLLSEIVGDEGRVFAVEVVPELKEFGEKNAEKYGFVGKGTLEFICADGSKGLEREAPFDKILASASGERIPEAWKKQLKKGGIIVAPVDESIKVLYKKGDDEFRGEKYEGFRFVPLVKK